MKEFQMPIIQVISFSVKDAISTSSVDDDYEEDCEFMFPGVDCKPVIYLYPKGTTPVTVKLDYDGILTATYPTYVDAWNVIATPDGTLTDSAGRKYYCLYWEGVRYAPLFDFSKGFVVPGDKTVEFLEDSLKKLGLNEREANEFIIYWLPQMNTNAYNLISFQTKTYTEGAELKITPAPDTLIRISMAWKGINAPVEIEPQELSAPERKGFTVVEWGGTRL